MAESSSGRTQPWNVSLNATACEKNRAADLLETHALLQPSSFFFGRCCMCIWLSTANMCMCKKYKRTYVYAYVCVKVNMYVYAYVYVCMCVCMHVSVYFFLSLFLSKLSKLSKLCKLSHVQPADYDCINSSTLGLTRSSSNAIVDNDQSKFPRYEFQGTTTSTILRGRTSGTIQRSVILPADSKIGTFCCSTLDSKLCVAFHITHLASNTRTLATST